VDLPWARRCRSRGYDPGVPDLRRHRGPHPEDPRLFAAAQLPALRAATQELSWLLTRDYASVSALKLVGDRHALQARQRLAVARCACPDAAREERARRELAVQQLAGRELWLDGYNVLTSLEAALAGGVILAARDGCYRDLASMHGSYRKVDETLPALRLLGEVLTGQRVSACRWLLDRPVSNSGRLKTVIEELARTEGWHWEVELVPDPDAVLAGTDAPIATADSHVLDQATSWVNLARLALERHVPKAWLVDLSHAGS
jgi:hypothetical protein